MDTPPEMPFLVPRTSRGREVAAYLTYLVDFYDRLPAYTVFIHSGENQWHNDLLGSKTSSLLESLRLAAVDSLGYVNLRCTEFPGCPTSVHPLEPTDTDIKNKDVRAYFAELYMELFQVGMEDVPRHIGAACCAQFAVSRERIRQRPKGDYERMLRWAAETKVANGFVVGWVFEYLWHLVFGMDAIQCVYTQCSTVITRG
ncbi:hypothetical protein PHISP_01124 [Aspergillus sp. HF37]|nr:hypothetical protein PHISP_01124 [Aspergillus sp. HF37]